MTGSDQIIFVDAYGKPATPLSERIFPAHPRIDLTIETQRSAKDTCPIEWAKKQKGNRALAEAALFDLSQYKDDRDLLEWAREQKIKIVFDLDKTSSHEAYGYCDFKKNAVIVKPDISVMRAQYAIIHELQHMFDRANGLVADNGMSMKSGTIVSRALEANANTREALHAWGCEYEIADGFYKPARVVEAYEAGTNISEIVTAARSSAHHLKTGKKDRFCRDVFQAFYRQESQIIFYDEGKLNFLTQASPKKPEEANEDSNRVFKNEMSTFMSDDSWTHKKIAEKIPFLANASFSLDEAQYYGLSHKVRDRYVEFTETIGTLSALSGYEPKYEIPICLFLPQEAVPLVQSPDRARIPLQRPFNTGYLPMQPSAAQQARLG